ncbi:unnamed protein product [Discula destructiva]
MPHQPCEEVGVGANVEEGSETDVESGHANERNESASFLRAFKDENHAPSHDEKQQAPHTGRSKIWRLGFALAPWELSLVLLMTLVSDRLQGETSCYGGAVEGQYILAGDHIEYRTEVMYDGVDNRNPMSEYQGWPNDEKDKLWDQYDGAMIRINREEAEKLPQLSQHVAVEEYKSEYVVGVTFTHTMHCLNSLRKKMYPGRYHHTSWIDEHGNFTYERWWHTDHCIEMLRRYIACHADTTAFTYDWIDDSSILVHPGTVHTCKNFDLVMDWLEEHRVDAPLRKHVEGGQIVDYADKPMGPAWDAVEMNAPKNWTFSKSDLWDKDVPASK